MRCAACDTVHAATEPCATLVHLRSGLSGTLLFPSVPTLPQAALPERGGGLEPGELLGHFRIVRELGAGGMGTVYLAEHVLMDKRVALKVLHERMALDASLVQRFITEASAIGRIQHDNVVAMFDLQVVPPGRYVLVMEYLEGRPLSALVGRALPAAQVVHLLAQVCDALGAAHALGVVHRDLKPANVFLVRRGADPHFVKLLDFGIAKLTASGDGSGRTLAGMVLGTPEYMAPEQGGAGPVDGRADLYALGVLGYQLLTGELPFRGVHPTDWLVAHAREVPLAPHVRRPGVPRALSEVLMRALAKRPEQRYPTAAALRAALEAALKAEEGEGRAVPPRALPAQWLRPGGEPARVQVRVVSRTGLLVALPAPLPPLHAELPLLLEGPEGRQLPCRIRVVQHVGEAQAATWGAEPGVAAELLDATPSLLAHLRRLQDGERLEAPQEAEALLREMAAVPVGDPYALLGLPRDADGAAVAQAARGVRTRLEALLGQPLSAEARSRVRTLLERVARAHQTLTTPERRAECDAALGNFRGVARCMEMGLSAHGLQRLQHAWHTRHPNLAGQAAVHFLSARALERAGQLTEALAAYERSLSFDPLDLVCLQQHHALLRRLHVHSAGTAPARRPGDSPRYSPGRDGGMASAVVSSPPGVSARR